MIQHINGFIYRIYSNDNKMNYYGLTTQENIQIRFKQHIEYYTQFYYNINHNLQQDIDYCSSFIIFLNYSLDNIHIQQIEQHTQITLKHLRNREKYYIQNFDCVNISGQKKQTDFYNIHKQLILSQNIIQNIIIEKQSQSIIPIIELLGYTIYYSNDSYIHIKHNKYTYLFTIKKQIINLLQQTYQITPNYNTEIIQIIDNILKKHNLQLLTQINYFNKIINYKLLLYPNIQIPIQKKTIQNIPLTQNERQSIIENIFNKRQQQLHL
jgi:hypothetical protein